MLYSSTRRTIKTAANDVASITIMFVGEYYEDAGYYEDYER